jgi:VanZ family protein
MAFRREYLAGRFQGWLSATVYATSVAVVLSVLQFFILSRGFDATDIVVRSVSASLSAWGAACFIRVRRPSRTSVLPELPGVSGRIARVLTACLVVYVLCRGFSPFQIRADGAMLENMWSGIGIVPLGGYFHGRIHSSADDILYKILRYAVFGGLAALAIGLDSRGPYRRRAQRVALCGALMSLAIELSQIYLPTRWPDLTHVLLGAFGSYAGAITARWARDYYRTVRSRWLARFAPEAIVVDGRLATTSPLNVEIPPPRRATDGAPLNVEIPPSRKATPQEHPPEQTSSPRDSEADES